MSQKTWSLGVNLLFLFLLIHLLIFTVSSEYHFYRMGPDGLEHARRIEPLSPLIVVSSNYSLSQKKISVYHQEMNRNYDFPVITSTQGIRYLYPGGPLGHWIVPGRPHKIQLAAHTNINTNDDMWSQFYPLTKGIMQKAHRVFVYNGKRAAGYGAPDTMPIFLRDNVYQLSGSRFFEKDLKSALEVLLDNQRPNGSFPEFIWNNPQTGLGELYDNLAEADNEYLAVWGVYRVWQATGDDQWVMKYLPSLEKGLRYSMTDPFRWSPEYELVKRPFTIDTWDFEYQNPGYPYNPEKAKLGIFHGDNTGMYLACHIMSGFYRDIVMDTQKSALWETQADKFKNRVNQYLWNGRFYRHRLPLTPVDVPGVNQDEILSLSNPMAITRGVASHQQSVQIIKEYQSRKNRAFIEWFSIDPYFPTGSFGTTGDWAQYAGQYLNGAVMPIVGGELSRASFDHGFESYGVSNLKRYYSLMTANDKAWLWFWRDGKPGVNDAKTFTADGWGASLMMNAFMEGLVGVQDKGGQFKRVRFTPRWSGAGVHSARAVLRYEASTHYLAYTYNEDMSNQITQIQITGSGSIADFSLMIPDGMTVQKIIFNGESQLFDFTSVESTRYVHITPTDSGFGTWTFIWEKTN